MASDGPEDAVGAVGAGVAGGLEIRGDCTLSDFFFCGCFLMLATIGGEAEVAGAGDGTVDCGWGYSAAGGTGVDV